MKATFLISLLLLTASNAAFSQSEELRYHPVFKTIPIPKNITIKDKGIMSAPLGNVTVQAPILTVKINGEGPFYFMFDTGFSGNLISKQVAKKAKLKKVDSIEHTGLTPSQTLQTQRDVYLVQTMTIGPVTFEQLGVSAASEGNPEYHTFQKIDGRGIDGIIGLNAFYGLKMLIDYQSEIIQVSKDSLTIDEPNVMRISKKSTVPLVELTLKFDKLKKEVAQNFVIDTGAYPYFFVNACDIPQMEQFTGKEQLLVNDYSGHASKTYFAQLYGKIQFNKSYAINSPYITYGSTHCNRFQVGLLGRGFFLKHKVIIDVDDFLVQFKPYKD